MVSLNRDLAAAFMVLTVAWTLMGLSVTPWVPLQEVATPVTQALILGVTVLVLAFIPVVMILKPWTALATAGVGLLNFVLVGVVGLLTYSEPWGPGVNAVFTAAFTLFALRAYRETLPASAGG